MKKKWIALVLAVMLVLSLLPTSAMAYTVTSGTCGDYGNEEKVTWSLDSNGLLTISGTGEMHHFFEEQPWKDLRQSITEVVIGSGVTNIGYQAFDGCTNLEKVTLSNTIKNIAGFRSCKSLKSINIPGSVEVISEGAFSNCTALTNIVLPDSVNIIMDKAFSGCTGLKEITLSKNISQIKFRTFENCSSLEQIVIPDSVTSIDYCAFANCSALKHVTLPKSLTSIGKSAFDGCSVLESVALPDGLKSIDSKAFYNCSALTDTVLPDGLKSIGDNAFSGCVSFTSVTIPDSVTSLDGSVFYGCKGLKHATIGNGVTGYLGGVFERCDNLESLVIGDGITEIVQYSFEDFGKLKSVVIGNGVTKIGGSAFSGCASLTDLHLGNSLESIGDQAFSACSELTSLQLPDSVTSIGTSAFEGCTALTDISFGTKLTTLGNSAFSDCTSLVSVVLPDSLTDMEGCVFDGCSSLKNVTIPNNVTSIGGSTFEDCTSLEAIVIPEKVTGIGQATFSGCTALKQIVLPAGLKTIGYEAFWQCDLDEIYYGGTEEQWTAVEVGSMNFLSGVTKHYNCVSPEGHWTVVVQEPTCEDRGYTRRTCACGIVKETSMDPLGHDYQNNRCTRCGDVRIPLDEANFPDANFRKAVQRFDWNDDGLLSGSERKVETMDMRDCGISSFAGIENFSSLTDFYCERNPITSFTVPASISYLQCHECPNLTNFEVADGNQTYTAADGILYSKDMTELVSYPAAKPGEKYTVPSSVTAIAYGAFMSGSTLKTVEIPDAVQEIEWFAFCDFTSLQTITIGSGVTDIGEKAFHKCDDLKDVYYNGTAEQWKAVQIGLNNESLQDAVMHYADGTTHIHSWDAGKVTKEATEDTNGVMTYTCTLCGAEKCMNIPYLSHEHSYKDVVTAPTCTAKGYTTHTCACGDSYVDTYTDALGHAWDSGKVTKEPTETETGVKTFTCTRCGETKTEVIPALLHEHSYKAVVTAPTCTAKGYTTHTCACGDSYVDAYTDALGHAWDEGKVTKEPTETETGVKTFTCTRCGETKTETIPATGVMDVTKMFTDVSHSWADDGIQYCVTHQLMSGIGNDLFGPKLTTTRAQIVQILYNLEGEPKVSGTTPFTDLTNDWYQDAILWAYQTGVVAGTSSTTFEPDLPVTREQIAVILMEYMTRVLKLERTWTPADLSIFPDAGSVSDWAKDAMADAVGLGLISGASNGGQTYLEPQGSATREQVATILMEFCKNVKK